MGYKGGITNKQLFASHWGPDSAKYLTSAHNATMSNTRLLIWLLSRNLCTKQLIVPGFRSSKVELWRLPSFSVKRLFGSGRLTTSMSGTSSASIECGVALEKMGYFKMDSCDMSDARMLSEIPSTRQERQVR